MVIKNSFMTAKYKKPKPDITWAQTYYSCTFCRGDILQKIERHEKVVAYGGKYTGGPTLPSNPYTIPVFVTKREFKCKSCEKTFRTTLFLKKKPSPKMVVINNEFKIIYK